MEPIEYEELTRQRIKSVNRLFLLTLGFYLAGSYLVGRLDLGLIGSLAVSQGVLVLPAVGWLVIKRVPVRSFLRLRRLDLPSLLLVLLFAFLLYPVLTLINAVSMLFLEYNISDTLSAGSASIPFAAMFLMVAVVPAVLEETVYRGVFFHAYREHSVWKGALLSGFLFGMMHANFNQFFYAFVLGVVFALLIEATGSLFSTMLVHLCYNGFSVLVLYGMNWLGEKSESFAAALETESEAGITPSMVLAMVPQAVFFGVLAFFVYRTLAKRNGTYETIRASLRDGSRRGSFRKLITVPLVLAAAFLLFLMVVNELLAMGIIK